MKNFNYAKNFKYFLIAALVIVVAGMAILGFLGFNNSSDYADAKEVKITASEVFDNDSSVIKSTASKVFGENGLKYTSVKSMDESRVVVYEFMSDVSDEVITQLQTALDEADLTASVDVTVEKFDTVSYKTFEEALWLILAVSILLVVAFVYLAFRYKWAAAFATLVSVIAYVLVAIALTAITRIPVTTAYVSVLTLGFVLSLATVVYNFSIVKEDSKNLGTAGSTPAEFANRAFAAGFLKNILTLGAVILVAIALLILGGAFVKYAALAVIVCSVSAIFVTVGLTGGIFATFKQLKK